MARFNYSGVAITGGTGRLNSSLGGSVLLKNGVVRNYVTPTNPQSALQSAIRTAFLFFTAAWKGLSEAQRNTWKAALTSGSWRVEDPFTGTGRDYSSAKALFISLNTNIYLIMDYPISALPVVNLTSAPAQVNPPAIGLTSIVADASGGTVAVTYTGSLGTDYALLVRMTQPVSPGNERLTSVRSELRQVGALDTASPQALGTAYVAKYGAITALTGQKIFYTVELVNFSNGQRSIVGTGSTIIVA